jgi:hypothetical protein
VKEDEMGGVCHMYGEEAKCGQGLVRKHEGRRPFRKPSCTWEDNIKMYLNSSIM